MMIECWKLYYSIDGSVNISQYKTKCPGNFDNLTKKLPKGGYTTFRTYEYNKVLRFGDHMARLISTAELSNFEIDLDVNEIKKAISEIVINNGRSKVEKKVRIIVDLEKTLGDVYILVDNLKIFAAGEYKKGVQVITDKNISRSNPKAKLTSFINETADLRKNLSQSINEVLILDRDGYVTEGMTSNFFAVEDNTIYTSNDSILNGITRDIVLEVINNKRLHIKFEPIHESRLALIAEAFLTSSSRGVLPIRSINGLQVGRGFIGPLTKRIYEGTKHQISLELEEI